MEGSLKKGQVALFSLITLIFMFSIVLFSTYKQKSFIEQYHFGTEKKIKELFNDYLINNYIYAKEEEILDHLFYNSFSFFEVSNSSNNSFFSKKLLRIVNVYNYSLKIVNNKNDNYFEKELKESGLDFSSGKEMRICLIKGSKEEFKEKEKCNVVLNKDYKESVIGFLNLIFDSYLQKNQKENNENLTKLFNITKNYFEENVKEFFKAKKFVLENTSLLDKSFMDNNLTFLLSNKYSWLLKVLSKKGEENKVFFEKIVPERWFYTFEKEYLIICREKYNLRIKEFFNFYNWERSNLKVIDCLAFKIKDKNRLKKFLESKDAKIFLERKNYNLEQYVNLNLFYLLSFISKKEIKARDKDNIGNYNYIDNFDDLLDYLFEKNEESLEDKRYLQFNLSKDEKEKLIKEFGVYKTLSVDEKELILLSNQLAITNLYSKNKDDYEIVIRVRDSCSFLPFSEFFYVKDKKGLENLIGKKEIKNILVQDFEKVFGDFYFYHLLNLENGKEYCILSEKSFENLK